MPDRAHQRTVIAQAGHDADTVIDEGLYGAADPDVVTAATADGRI